MGNIVKDARQMDTACRREGCHRKKKSQLRRARAAGETIWTSTTMRAFRKRIPGRTQSLDETATKLVRPWNIPVMIISLKTEGGTRPHRSPKALATSRPVRDARRLGSNFIHTQGLDSDRLRSPGGWETVKFVIDCKVND